MAKKKTSTRMTEADLPPTTYSGDTKLPDGRVVSSSTSYYLTRRGARAITVTGVRRAEPDYHKFALMLIDLAKRELAKRERLQAEQADAGAAADGEPEK